LTGSTYHTDIKQNGFFDRFCPPALIPYMKLARFDRPVGVWLTVLPGFWALTAASDADLPFFYFMLFIIGGFSARAAGCIINDIWDRRLDRKVERTAIRPLASGALSLSQAAAFLFLMLAISFAVLLQLPPAAIWVGACALIPISVYPLMKRITFWPQLFLGLVFNLSIPIGWLCIQPEISAAPLLMYGAAVLFTLGYDTIYAFQDIDDDLQVGIKSTAIRFQNHPKLFVSISYILGFLLLLLSIQTWLVIFGAAHLAMQIYIWQPKDRANSLAVFKSHVFFQAVIFLGLILQGI